MESRVSSNNWGGQFTYGGGHLGFSCGNLNVNNDLSFTWICYTPKMEVGKLLIFEVIQLKKKLHPKMFLIYYWCSVVYEQTSFKCERELALV